MSRAQEIEAIRTEYPKHNKIAYALAIRSAETGVTFTERANALREGKNTPKKDYHKLTHRMAVRLSQKRYDEVKQLIEADGRFSSTQAWLEWWIAVWVNTKKKAADAATSTAISQIEDTK